MSPDHASSPSSPPPACDTCGREAVIVIDARGWCESCLHARGSCCAESEMED
ncbi:hypothetical protein OKA04_11995 [Luteolibacter flavescens]|uniref:Uncharacterized protein n=1 Tax=Luteolibacter flavescens TaxID=1859460 RepID=A0ABT3FPH1_9BACT|nr:hypothetical protein [Luteolibacter flavescens]MCW1885453.1 hypothetical protein [Luteolibacter flavescens]